MQHVVPNNVARYYVEMLRAFGLKSGVLSQSTPDCRLACTFIFLFVSLKDTQVTNIAAKNTKTSRFECCTSEKATKKTVRGKDKQIERGNFF